MLQMAQIILFMASVALDSLIMTPSRHRGTMQQTSASVCSQWWCSRGWQCLSEPQMMWLWVNRTLITGQGICLLHVYIPMMHEMSWEMDFISSAWCIVTYQASTRRYRACVIMETSTKWSWDHVNVPARLNYWINAASCRLHCTYMCLVQFIFNSNNSPRHFLIFYEPFASHAYTLLFYCHSYVWMVWIATSVGSLRQSK